MWMSTQHLGAQVDIHTGGVDNIFPHHEDERAQSEAFTGVRPFARVWLHGQHLLADGLKMAKSNGNAYTLSDLLALNFEPLAFRYLCLTAHYRARLNFTFTSLCAAQTGLYRLRWHVARWGTPSGLRNCQRRPKHVASNPGPSRPMTWDCPAVWRSSGRWRADRWRTCRMHRSPPWPATSIRYWDWTWALRQDADRPTHYAAPCVVL